MQMLRKIFLTALLLFLLLPASVPAQEPFYKGKTITIVNGRSPGGTGDMRVRAVVTFLRKYIPGEPTIVLEYMSGAGGRMAANHIARSARPDGLTIGNVGGGLIGNAVLGQTGVQYDLNKLIYLGAPNSVTHYVFVTRKKAGLDTLQKLMSKAGVRIGAQAVGHDVYFNGRLFAYLIGLKEPKFVTG